MEHNSNCHQRSNAKKRTATEQNTQPLLASSRALIQFCLIRLLNTTLIDIVCHIKNDQLLEDNKYHRSNAKNIQQDWRKQWFIGNEQCTRYQKEVQNEFCRPCLPIGRWLACGCDTRQRVKEGSGPRDAIYSIVTRAFTTKGFIICVTPV